MIIVMNKGYLFGSIFYDKDRVFNDILALGIRQAWPGIDLYVPQEATFNDKKTFADSAMIYQGDYERLKNSDLLIGCLDGDVPPIGSVTELGIFSELAQNNPDKHIIVLLTDTRDAAYTLSTEKIQDMQNNQASSQFNYFNLFTKGVIENSGVIVRTPQQLYEYVHQLYLQYVKTHHISGIYKLTNRLNQKSYIGKSIDIYKRWYEHCHNMIQNIDIAITVDGAENFVLEILEECDPEQLTEREQYWTNTYFNCSTYVPNGYNVGLAGSGGPQVGQVVSCYTLTGELVKTFASLHEASREYHVNPTAIFQAVNNYTLSQNLQWRYGLEQQIPVYNDPTIKSCYITNLFGETLQIFESRTQAAQWLDIKPCTVITAIKNQACVLNKYYIFDTTTTLDSDFFANKMPKTIYCYDATTRNFVIAYDTLAQAATALNIDRHRIAFTCKGAQYYCAGYIMSYLKYDKIPSNFKELNQEYYATIKISTNSSKLPSNIKPVFQYDILTKKLIARYDSLAAAAYALEKFNGSSNIALVTHGVLATAYGYIWSYIEWDTAPDDYVTQNHNFYTQQENINEQ